MGKTGPAEVRLGQPDAERFQAAVNRVVSLDERERVGIGMQKEKSVHAILKDYMDPDPSHQEIPVGNYIADIFDGQGITEIQTANFYAMREKLAAFLPEYPVRIVYPIPHVKYVTWIDPATGELLETNRRGVKGSFYEVFRELYRIDSFLADPNLTIHPVLLDLTEYRVRDGWSTDGKRGSHRYDRVPSGIFDEIDLKTAADYLRLVPESLPEPFTAKEFENSAGIHRKAVSFATVLRILTQVGAVERVGVTQRRAYLYRRRECRNQST